MTWNLVEKAKTTTICLVLVLIEPYFFLLYLIMVSKWIDFHDGILSPMNDQSSTIPTTFIKTNFSPRDENISDHQNHDTRHQDNNPRNVHWRYGTESTHVTWHKSLGIFDFSLYLSTYIWQKIWLILAVLTNSVEALSEQKVSIL